MMSTTNRGACLSKQAQLPRRRNNGLGTVKRTDDSHKPKCKKAQPGTFAWRISHALPKAAAARRKQLGRPLSPDEWLKLKIAVKKQCRNVARDTVSSAIRQLALRVQQLENVNPQGAQALADSISMFQTQVSALRRQALDHLVEHSETRPTCPHFRKRRAIHVSSGVGARFFAKFENLGYVSYCPQDRIESLACPQCVKSREDSVFLWSGSSLDSFEEFTDSSPISSAVISACGLTGIPPLSIQEVWNSVLLQKYGNVE